MNEADRILARIEATIMYDPVTIAKRCSARIMDRIENAKAIHRSDLEHEILAALAELVTKHDRSPLTISWQQMIKVKQLPPADSDWPCAAGEWR